MPPLENHSFYLNFAFKTPKTKEFSKIMSNIGVAGKKTLLIMGDAENNNVKLSVRNLPKTDTAKAIDLNTYTIMNAQCIVLSESTLNMINQMAENN